MQSLIVQEICLICPGKQVKVFNTVVFVVQALNKFSLFLGKRQKPHACYLKVTQAGLVPSGFTDFLICRFWRTTQWPVFEFV